MTTRRTTTNETEAYETMCRETDMHRLPGGTRVGSTLDGEAGVIMNGYAGDPIACRWDEYEVETAYGIEIWKTTEMFLLPTE